MAVQARMEGPGSPMEVSQGLLLVATLPAWGSASVLADPPEGDGGCCAGPNQLWLQRRRCLAPSRSRSPAARRLRLPIGWHPARLAAALGSSGRGHGPPDLQQPSAAARSGRRPVADDIRFPDVVYAIPPTPSTSPTRSASASPTPTNRPGALRGHTKRPDPHRPRMGSKPTVRPVPPATRRLGGRRGPGSGPGAGASSGPAIAVPGRRAATGSWSP